LIPIPTPIANESAKVIDVLLTVVKATPSKVNPSLYDLLRNGPCKSKSSRKKKKKERKSIGSLLYTGIVYHIFILASPIPKGFTGVGFLLMLLIESKMIQGNDSKI
jgi:hypothetical protein